MSFRTHERTMDTSEVGWSRAGGMPNRQDVDLGFAEPIEDSVLSPYQFANILEVHTACRFSQFGEVLELSHVFG